MKATLSILAGLMLLATAAWAQGGTCDYVMFMVFDSLTVTHNADDIVISAAITITDARLGHAADYFSCRQNEHDAWGFGGQLGNENDDYYFLHTYRSEPGEPDCNGVSLNKAGGPRTSYPAIITDSRFTLHIPSSQLSGNRFTYHFSFYESGSGNCEQWFDGTFERTDKTPTRRVSFGGLKAAYR